jgi:cysteine-rich repeat protein
MKIVSRFLFASSLLAGCVGEPTSAIESAASGSVQLSGALFTTTVDGSRVNANIYRAKTDVYLDGGPGNNAPAGAAALPAGDYYFQVTDPSGHVVLSQDALACRRVRITSDGVIDQSYAGTGCQHATGTDVDQASLGAVTVQLMPYADTPNNGGEYKAWITPVADIGANGEFIHNRSKVDNFKVRDSVTPPPPAPSCGDHNVDAGEQCDDGNMTSGDGCSATCQNEMNPPPPPPQPCCGDGMVGAGEACDDGNMTNGDGCSATCQIEPPPPPPVCGNEVLEDGEDCDDGNTANGDGCSDLCVHEPGCETLMYDARVDG